MSTTQIIISALGLLGLGGLLKSILDFFVEDRKRKSESKHVLKEERYKAIILLCYALINYDKEKENLKIRRHNIKTKDDLFEEVYLEWVNMPLYASDSIIKTTKMFLENYNQQTFSKAVIAMRKDLYNIRTHLSESDLTIRN